MNFDLVNNYFMIYDLARDQKDKFKDGLDVYKLIEKDELVVRRSRGSSAELGPGCPSCFGRLEAEQAADAATRGGGELTAAPLCAARPRRPGLPPVRLGHDRSARENDLPGRGRC